MKLSQFKPDEEIFKMAMQDLLPKDVLKKRTVFAGKCALGKYWDNEKLRIQSVYNSKQKCPNSLNIFNRSLALSMYYMLGGRGY